MSPQDAEFVQILNIIRRGDRLVLQAKREGADTKLAEEFINEAKYALKMNKREEAIEFAKGCFTEIIKAKKELDIKNLSQEGALEKLSKEELRQKCIELGLEPLGLKTELMLRIREFLSSPKMGARKPSSKEREDEEEEDLMEEEEAPAPEPAPVPVSTEWSPEKAAYDLTSGLSYLVEEKRPDRVFHIFRVLTDLGQPGLAISRTNPKILSRNFSLNESESIWLTGKEMQGEIRSVLPILEFIMSLIEDFMTNNKKGVILIDGVEYLLTNNKFNSVLRFIRQLVDNVSQSDCILLVSLAPEALDSTEVTLLEKDLQPINYLE